MKISDLLEHDPFEPVSPPQGDDEYRAMQILIQEQRLEKATQALDAMFTNNELFALSHEVEEGWVRLAPWNHSVGIKNIPANKKGIDRALRYLKQYKAALHALLNAKLPERTVSDVKAQRVRFLDQQMNQINFEAELLYQDHTIAIFADAETWSHINLYKDERWFLAYTGNNHEYFARTDYRDTPTVKHMVALNEMYHKFKTRLEAIKNVPEY